MPRFGFVIVIMFMTAGCATGAAPIHLAPPADASAAGQAKTYGLDPQSAFDAIRRGESRQALTYYEGHEVRAAAAAPTLSWGFDLARALALAGYTSLAVGEIGKASTYLDRAGQAINQGWAGLRFLDSRDRPADWHRNAEIDDWRRTIAIWKAEAYRSAGDLDTAREFLELELKRQTDDFGKVVFSLALASIVYESGDYARVVEIGRDVERFLSNKRGMDRDPWGVPTDPFIRGQLAAAFIVRGNAEIERGKFADAEESLKKAVALSRGAGQSMSEFDARVGLVKVAYRSGREAGAEKEARALVSESMRRALLGHATAIQTEMAINHARQRRYADALHAYREVIDKFELTRTQFSRSDMRSLFLEKRQAIYQGAIDAAVNLGDARSAFALAERSRSREFLDLLGTYTRTARMDAPEIREAAAKLQTFVEVSTAAALSEQTGAAAETAVRSAQARNIAVTEYSTLLDRVRLAYPEQASLMTVDPVSAEDVQRLLPADVALIEYLVTEAETLAWIIDRRGIEMVRLPVTRSVLVGAVTALRRAITEQADLSEVVAQGRVLHRLLFVEIEPHLSSRKIIVAPHDVLHYLPFGTLRTARATWLVEDYTVTTVPSASVLKYLDAKREAALDSALIVGNPALGAGLGLPFAGREARMVAEHFPRAEVLLGDQATKETVKRLSRGAGVVHFATHADLQEKNPLDSALLLTPDGDDGRLKVREVFGLDLKARLVVLSACETGLGALSRGDEVVGLQRAFIYAGTPAVITTLWKVDDRSTYELMRAFYAQLDVHDAAEALARAQRATLNQLPHPFAWAGFVFTGVIR